VDVKPPSIGSGALSRSDRFLLLSPSPGHLAMTLKTQLVRDPIAGNFCVSLGSNPFSWSGAIALTRSLWSSLADFDLQSSDLLNYHQCHVGLLVTNCDKFY